MTNLNTPIERRQGEYNMPSIEHNGEAWIRLVDHVELTTQTHQATIAECVRKIKAVLGESSLATDIIKAITSNKE